MPLKSIADSNPMYKGPLTALSRYLTPHRPRKNERKSFSAADFDDVHRSIAERQYTYIGWPRSNSVKVRNPWFGTLAPSEAHLLNAANVEARIRFAKTAVHEVIRHLGEASPACFFTVCPRHYVKPLTDAHRVDLHSLRKLTGQVFSGCSFVGAVDFALFKGFGKGGLRHWHNHVGAHTHGILWGKSIDEVRAMLRALSPDFVNVKGESGAYVQDIGPDEIAGYMRYSLKLPLFEYNLTADDSRYDAETGEILTSVKVNSHPLRPGDQLRMAALLHDMSLDHLIFGQLEGTPVVREIRRRARLPITRMNEDAVRRGLLPNCQIGTEEIDWSRRTAVRDLILNPPKKVWLGPKPSTAHLQPFLLGERASGAPVGAEKPLSDLVFH